jgi:hypothetical protein
MSLKSLAAPLVLIAVTGLNAAPLFADAAVAIAPVKISVPLQKALQDQYGESEAAVLQSAVAERLARSLKSAGASVSDSAQQRIEISIDDAKPSHPTRFQIQKNPSLDPLRSRSLGGARLHAVLKGAAGKVLDQVEYHDYAMSFQEASPSGDAWADARVAIERFAAQVVKSWRRNAG